MGRALSDHVGPGLRYLNVGHSNIHRSVFQEISSVERSRIVVLLHDVIPLDHPAFQQPQTVADFALRLDVVSEMASLTIHPSEASRRSARRHFQQRRRVPPSETVRLGVERLTPNSDNLPPELDLTHGCFVVLGTIEPRKNHALLLDIWDRLGPQAPPLVVLGRRGWRNEEVFRRLDAANANVIEMNDLNDGAVAAILDRSKALLFPSFAEGFGLPPAEAALLGVPAICSDLPVLREVLGDCAVYLDSGDSYAWETAVRNLYSCRDEGCRTERRSAAENRLPRWEDHLKTVLGLL